MEGVDDIVSNYSTPQRSCVNDGVEQLRKEVNDLRREIECLRAIVLNGANQGDSAKKSFKVPIEIKLPIFRDENRDSPIEFMRSFDQYCAIKEVPSEFIPILLESALQDRAGMWFQVVKNELYDFDQFRTAFVNEFFSVEVKTRAKDAWRNRKYTNTEGPMLSFCYKQISEIGHIDPSLSEYERNYIILKQLPTEVQIGSSGIDLNDTKKLTYAIGRIDDARRRGNEGESNERFKNNNFRNNDKPSWGNYGYDKSRDAFTGTNLGKNWGTERDNPGRFKRFENPDKFRQNGEFRNAERQREFPRRGNRDGFRPINDEHRNRLDSNHQNNRDQNINRSSWRDPGTERSNGIAVGNNKRVAPISISHQNKDSDRLDPSDLNTITVEAEIHNLNE